MKEALPKDAWHEGIALFNHGKYWDAHEALETLWLKADGLDKHFYAGFILLAAALHKQRVMDSQRGGRRNYAKALRHWALLPDYYHDVDIRELEARVHKALRKPELHPEVPLL